MSSTTFDTLGYFEKLKAAGVPEIQAKAQVEVIREVIEDKLATKRDLKELELAMEKNNKELELRLTIRFGSMIAAAVAVLAALMAILR
jgi:hypothetical protein